MQNNFAGRTRNRRFALGHPGRPGDPCASMVSQFRSSLYDAFTPEDLSAVLRVLVFKAKEGHVPAIKLLFKYLK